MSSIKSSIMSNSLCVIIKQWFFTYFMTEDTISVYKIFRFYLSIFNNIGATVCFQKLSVRIITHLYNMVWLSSLDYKAHWANCSILKITVVVNSQELVVFCTSMNLKAIYISNMLDFILSKNKLIFREFVGLLVSELIESRTNH